MRTIGPDLDEPTRRWVQDRAERRLGKYAPHIERLSFRFEDVNGPRGGEDIVCRGKVVLSGQRSTIVEKRARTARDAFNLVSRQLERGVGKAVGRHGQKVRLQSSADGQRATRSDTTTRHGKATGTGSLIGRRVGRSRSQLQRLTKARQVDAVDTALEGVSASDRKVGAGATAKRNTKLNTRRATVTLEDSATGQPSRKSTRRSQNRALSGTKLARKAKRTLASPKRRAGTKRAQTERRRAQRQPPRKRK
jgi:hypothetical protein